MRRQTADLREGPRKVERAPRRKCAEFRKGYVLRVVSLQVFSNLPDDEILPANPQTLSPLFDMRSSEMLDDCQQE
jgi:hypothetical protein